jgi:hypothetical protein
MLESTETLIKRSEHEATHNDSFNNSTKQETFKGSFSPEEVETLKKSLCDYAMINNFDEIELMKLVSNESMFTSKCIWEFISSKLPHRTLQSIKSFCQRRFNPNNYRGKWTEKEVSYLIDLVNKHGCKWQKLSQFIDRTPTNIRDKWRSIGDCNFKERSHQKVWSVHDILKLIRLIEITHKVKIFYVASDDEILNEFTLHKENKPFLQIGRDNKSLNAMCRKIVCNYMVKNVMTIISTLKIKWNLIAKMMETKSKDDCRNFWRSQIIKELSGKAIFQKRWIIKLLEELESHHYELEDEIEWECIKVPNAKRIWGMIMSQNPGSKSLQQIIEESKKLFIKISDKKYKKYQTYSTKNELASHYRVIRAE